MRQRRVVSALAIPLVLAFVAASCGSDDSSTEPGTDPGTATEATTATETTDEPTTEDTVAVVTVPDVDTSIVAETTEVVYGGNVTIGIEAESPGLRPWDDNCSAPCYVIMRSIYDPLMERTSVGDYEPFLAESLEANDDLTVWTLTLRPDVTFHNGVALTAQTIADMFPLQQVGTAGASAVSAAFLTAVTAIDELTVEYTLSEPNVAFAGALATAPIGFPFEPAAAAADSAAFSLNPIGTGPFVMSKRDLDNETVVERNPDYWFVDVDGNQLPFLDTVTFRPTPEENTRLSALESGTIDALQTLRGATIRDARAVGGLELIAFTGNSTGGGMYNTSVAPFDDQRVRNGLTSLNDQTTVIAALGAEGISEVTTQWFSADSPWWTQAAADAYRTFDFEAGKALLQEYIDDPARSDGKAVGEKIDVPLACPPDPTLTAAMQVLQQVWDGSGLVNTSVTSAVQGEHIATAFADEHGAHCWRWGTDNDPSTAIAPFVGSNVDDDTGSDGNLTSFEDPEMLEWSIEATATDDFETRRELYSKIMVRINELSLTWYSGGTPTMIAYRPGIEGFNTWTLPSGSLGAGISPEAQTRWFQVFITE